MIEILTTAWGFFLGAAGAAAAILLVIREYYNIVKMQLEIDRLREAASSSEASSKIDRLRDAALSSDAASKAKRLTTVSRLNALLIVGLLSASAVLYVGQGLALSRQISRLDERVTEAITKEVFVKLTADLESSREESDRLRSRLYTIDQQRGGDEPPFAPRVLLGVALSSRGDRMPDAKVEVTGGSQTYTNSNGEFQVEATVGDTVLFESPEGRVSFIVEPADLRHPRIIRIER